MKSRMVLVAFLMMLYIVPSVFISSYGLSAIPTEQNSNKDFTISANWYDESWAKRKNISIDGSAGAGINYTVRVNVTYDNDMQADFDDIRFTDNESVVLLDYWRESYIASTNATFWVKVSDNLDTGTLIHMYYGNSLVTTTSNGDNTFIQFSDFSRFMDLDTWSRYSAADDYVQADDISSSDAISTVGKCEGLAYDGTYYYISTYDYATNESWLYKINSSWDIIDSENITDCTLTHSGGMILYNGYLYVTLAEPISTPNNPSKVNRYDSSTLSYVDTVVTSASYGDDHWGGVVIVEELDRMYVGNYGTDSIYVFEIDGDYITTITDEPDINIQDWVYIDGFIYGSKVVVADNIISVCKPSANGNDLIFMGEIVTEVEQRTNNGFTWYGGYFYCGVVWPDDDGDNYIHKLDADLELVIENYYIYNDTLIGPNLMIESRVKMGGNQNFNLGWAENVPVSGTTIILHNSGGNIKIYEGNEDDDTNFDIAQDTWTTLSLGWVEGNATAFKNRASGHQTDDVNITGDSLKPQLNLWGSADEPIFVKWIFIRDYIIDEPFVSSFGAEYPPPAWGLVGSADLVFVVAVDTAGLDMLLIMGGLILIPCSTLYLVKGGKDDMSSNKFFYFCIAFIMGWALFLGGIM